MSLIAFLFVESRVDSPIIPLHLFRNPTFAWGSLARFLFGAAFLGAILFLSLYLVQVQGVSATAAGTATIPLTFGLIFGAIVSGQIASRMGRYKPLMLIGLSLMMLGFYFLSTLNADTSYNSVILRMVLLGLGIGPAMPLYTTALQLSVKPWEMGVATSAGQFFQQMGSTIGTAIFGALLTTGLTENLSTSFAAQASANTGTVATTLHRISAQVARGENDGPVDRNASPSNEEIRARFARLRQNVTSAVQTGDRDSIAALRGDNTLPQEARTQFTQIPEGALRLAYAAVLTRLTAPLLRPWAAENPPGSKRWRPTRNCLLPCVSGSVPCLRRHFRINRSALNFLLASVRGSTLAKIRRPGGPSSRP
ncbi:MFS transporter [Deinococcus malanensis]|uniref:MFS transporter n=1 Tax=Deinococcus malanensis TaxID=1706855 RepID=UPI00363E77D1